MCFTCLACWKLGVSVGRLYPVGRAFTPAQRYKFCKRGERETLCNCQQYWRGKFLNLRNLLTTTDKRFSPCLGKKHNKMHFYSSNEGIFPFSASPEKLKPDNLVFQHHKLCGAHSFVFTSLCILFALYALSKSTVLSVGIILPWTFFL